jgi:hypothetical protein
MKKILKNESEQLIPVSIFNKPKLSPFEAIVKYLKEEKGLNYHQIGEILNRDERNIWTVYNRAKKKWKNY